MTIARALVLTVAVVAVSAACSGGGGSSTHTVTVKTVQSASTPSLQSLFVHVVQDVSPSVVQIQTSAGLGSGVVYNGKGDIVTNAHVVGGAKRLTVTLTNGDQRPARLVGTFPPNDIAVVHVDGGPPPPARFGSSRPLAVGDIVLAIGNPLGLRSSVTDGIVSSLGRTVSEGNGIVLPSVIQTSAPINPGNSGGALVDIAGEVIGIPTLAALDPEFGSTPAAGIGFAIPSGDVKRIADQLIRDGKVTESGRAYLGVEVASPLTGGLLVVSVIPGGPAAAAGIERGDRIISVDGQPVADVEQLATVLAGLRPGQTIPVRIVRHGKQLTIDVALGQLKS